MLYNEIACYLMGKEPHKINDSVDKSLKSTLRLFLTLRAGFAQDWTFG
jgi:hypothetical protein